MSDVRPVLADPNHALPDRLAWTLTRHVLTALDYPGRRCWYEPDDRLSFCFEVRGYPPETAEGIVLWRPFWTIRWKEKRVVTDWPETTLQRWRFARLLLRSIDWAPS
jgi:hypothetical protein